MICVFGTPPARAVMQQSIFGIIPEFMIPVAFREPIAVRSILFIKDDGSFTSLKTPGTFVSCTNFSALSATAILAAAVSAFML